MMIGDLISLHEGVSGRLRAGAPGQPRSFEDGISGRRGSYVLQKLRLFTYANRNGPYDGLYRGVR
jgi:hypothetical protein